MTQQSNTRLAALIFRRDIERLTGDFTGRAWLFEEIDNWLHNSEQRFFILTGEPGAGKSAIAARLTQIRQQYIVAYHFCTAGSIGTVAPNTVLRSLAAQLGETLPGYGEALAKTNDLPVWVRFVCTTRPEDAVLSYFKHFESYTLAAESQMNLNDIDRYIAYRVSQDKMQTGVTSLRSNDRWYDHSRE